MELPEILLLKMNDGCLPLPLFDEVQHILIGLSTLLNRSCKFLYDEPNELDQFAK